MMSEEADRWTNHSNAGEFERPVGLGTLTLPEGYWGLDSGIEKDCQ